MDKFSLMKQLEQEMGKPASEWGSQDIAKLVDKTLKQEQGELETESAVGEVYKG